MAKLEEVSYFGILELLQRRRKNLKTEKIKCDPDQVICGRKSNRQVQKFQIIFSSPHLPLWAYFLMNKPMNDLRGQHWNFLTPFSTTEAGRPQWRCRRRRCTEATPIPGQPSTSCRRPMRNKRPSRPHTWTTRPCTTPTWPRPPPPPTILPPETTSWAAGCPTSTRGTKTPSTGKLRPPRPPSRSQSVHHHHRRVHKKWTVVHFNGMCAKKCKISTTAVGIENLAIVLLLFSCVVNFARSSKNYRGWVSLLKTLAKFHFLLRPKKVFSFRNLFFRIFI